MKISPEDQMHAIDEIAATGAEAALIEATVAQIPAAFDRSSPQAFRASLECWLSCYRKAVFEALPGGASVPVDEAGVALGRPIPGPESLYAERAAELALALARVVREARLYIAGSPGSREHLINACISAEELL